MVVKRVLLPEAPASCNIPVPEALLSMQQAVKCGELQEANDIGGNAEFPLNLSSTDVQRSSKISSGAEAEVHGGLWKGIPVALKKPRIRTTRDLFRFRNELALLCSFRHSSVIQPLGARALPPDYFLVLPLEGQSLHAMLHEGNRWRPGWEDVLAIGVAAAGALTHVHESGVIHRDVKPGNLLWTGDDRRVVLVDFGIAIKTHDLEDGVEERASRSRGKPSGGFHKSKTVGSLEYMAPEVLQKHSYSYSSDVYAFAVTLNEIATGIYPFSDCTKDNPDVHTVLEMGYGRQELSTAVASEGLRPSLPQGILPSGYTDLMRACWRSDPAARPRFPEVLHLLTAMLWQVKRCQQLERCLSITDVEPGSQNSVGNFTGKLGHVLNAAKRQVPGANSKCHVAENKENTPEALDHKDVGSLSIQLPGRLWRVESVSGDNVYQPTVVAGAFVSAGLRGSDRMEDRHCIVERFLGLPNAMLLGVFDGHRGHEAAAYTAEGFPTFLSNSLVSQHSLAEGMLAAFHSVEHHFAASSKAAINRPNGVKYPGCTALTLLLWGNQLVIANAGDCRAILCRSGRPIQLTVDHTANNLNERERIIAAGGTVHWMVDGWRVGKAGMQVTRSIGDEDLKPFGVIAHPEVSTVELSTGDEFLVLATDGFWDTVTNEEAIGLIYDTVKDPELCAKRLVTEALAKGSQDNVTVIVTFLTPVSTVEQVYCKGD